MTKLFEIVNCEDCVFFNNPIPFENDVTIGHCQRFPPTGALRATTGKPNFATTLSNWWCGEGREGSK